MEQTIILGKDSHREISGILSGIGVRKYMLVHGGAFSRLPIRAYFDGIPMPCVRFGRFTPNPTYEDVLEGVALFNREECDALIGVGGGSSLDVAKCIKLFCRMDPAQEYIAQVFKDSRIPLIALPTTAGTGSESTRFAVIYRNGEKQSIAHDSILPDYAILEPSVLKTLPLYQKKCTMLDALCQGIESWWSIHSTFESRVFSRSSVERIVRNYRLYLLDGEDEASQQMLMASNDAGRAINIAQTTAAHAMSYQLTKMYHLPHGHAVAVCLPKVWRYMLLNPDRCTDPRGLGHLLKTFDEIGDALGAQSSDSAIEWFEALLAEMQMELPVSHQNQDVEILGASVNATRLKNNPVYLGDEALVMLYRGIVVAHDGGKNLAP